MMHPVRRPAAKRSVTPAEQKAIFEAGRARFKKDDRAEKQARMEACEFDVLRFGRTYLPHYFVDPPADMHVEMSRELPRHSLQAWAAPRDGAKTTLLSLGYALQNICYGRHPFILLFGDAEPQATSNLSDIKAELEENRKITDDFGDLVGRRKWAETDARTTNGIRLMAKGMESRFRGIKNRARRPSLIIVDDPENDASVESEAQRAKIRKRFFKGIINALAINGQLVVIGTLLHYDCLLAHLLENPEFFSRKYKAILDGGGSYWPSRYPVEALERKRAAIGSVAFSTEFQNEPIDEETQKFPPEIFCYYDPNALPELIHYGFVDPGLGKKKSDFTAIATVGVDAQGWIYTLNVVMERLRPKETVRRILALWPLYRWAMLGIEDVAYQIALKDDIDEESRKREVYIPTAPIPRTVNKISRIMSVNPLIENGTLQFNKGDRILLEQFFHFPKGAHDDGPDAVEGCVQVIRDFGGGGESVLVGPDERADDGREDGRLAAAGTGPLFERGGVNLFGRRKR